MLESDTSNMPNESLLSTKTCARPFAKIILFFLSILWLSGCAYYQSFFPEDKQGAPNSANIIKIEKRPELTSSAIGNPQQYVIFGKTYTVLNTSKGYSIEGKPTFYQEHFQGKTTNSGRVYNMYVPSASSNTLPLPSYAKLTNLKNKKSIIVVVNDRGPFHGTAVTRISYAARVLLDIPPNKEEVPNISLTTIAPYTLLPENSMSLSDHNKYYVQLVTFNGRQKAERAQKIIEIVTNQSPLSIRKLKDDPDGKSYGLFLGPYETRQKADAIAYDIKKNYAFKPKVMQ